MSDLLNNLPPIHREGRRFIIIFAAITLVLFYLWVPLGFLGVILTLWCTYFFRDPERVSPRQAGQQGSLLEQGGLPPARQDVTLRQVR
jgi:phosphatidylserine decarboxylase